MISMNSISSSVEKAENPLSLTSPKWSVRPMLTLSGEQKITNDSPVASNHTVVGISIVMLNVSEHSFDGVSNMKAISILGSGQR